MLAKGAPSRVGIGKVALSVCVDVAVSVGVRLGSGVGVRLGRSARAVGMPVGKAIQLASAVVAQSMTPAALMMTDHTK